MQINLIEIYYEKKMKSYIFAIEKLVIKDLVDWKNKVIKTTKEVINNDNNTEN